MLTSAPFITPYLLIPLVRITWRMAKKKLNLSSKIKQ